MHAYIFICGLCIICIIYLLHYNIQLRDVNKETKINIWLLPVTNVNVARVCCSPQAYTIVSAVDASKGGTYVILGACDVLRYPLNCITCSLKPTLIDNALFRIQNTLRKRFSGAKGRERYESPWYLNGEETNIRTSVVS